MADDTTFEELRRKRVALDHHLNDTGSADRPAGILVTAEVIDERLRAATSTIRTPSRRDRRSRGTKGPSDPTGAAIAGSVDYARAMRSRWHQIVRGHAAPLVPDPPPPDDPEQWLPHVCPDLDDEDLDPESLVGMAHRLGADLDGLTGDEARDTQLLAHALGDAWHALYESTEPDVWVLSTVERDLRRARGRLQGIADDLRLWSDESHPSAGRTPDPCRCDGTNCRHDPGGCPRLTDGRTKCGACRKQDSRAADRAGAA